jgi:hypothetical protein
MSLTKIGDQLMIDRTEMIAATRRLRAASRELTDDQAAAEAAARMGYLWAYSVRQGGVLEEEDLEVAIWAFFIEYPDGLTASRRRR